MRWRSLPSPSGATVCPPRRSSSELTGGGATLEPGREARAAAEDQLLREAGRSQRDQEAAECLTPLCHGWLKKNHHNHNKGGSGGGEAAAGEGAAGEGAAGSGAGGSMRRRGSRGSSMRSVVGFLSQRGLEGDPLLTQDFQRRRLRGCRNLYKKDLLGHFGCVNAIEFSNNGGQWLVSGKANVPVPRPFPPPPPQEASSSPAASPAARGRGAAAALLKSRFPNPPVPGNDVFSSRDLKWLTGFKFYYYRGGSPGQSFYESVSRALGVRARGALLFDGSSVFPLKRGFSYFGGTTTEEQPRGARCGHRVTFVSAVPRAGGQQLLPGAGGGPEFGRGGCSTARHRREPHRFNRGTGHFGATPTPSSFGGGESGFVLFLLPPLAGRVCGRGGYICGDGFWLKVPSVACPGLRET